MTTHFLSHLRRVYTVAETGERRLNMVEITGCEAFSSFAGLRDFVLNDLRYPTAQRSRFETYGWLPSSFDPGDYEFLRKDGTTRTRHGLWRVGEAERDRLSVFCADVDNADETKPMLSPQDVADALCGLGLSYFTYTSYSHTPDRPRFRVVVDLDRPIRRAEAADLFVVLNEAVFGGQGDPAIYDSADFLFAPPYTCSTAVKDGAALPVDGTLACAADLKESNPGLWDVFARTDRLDRAGLTPEQAAEHRAEFARLRADHSVRTEVHANDPRVVRPEWIEDYVAERVGGSRWQTMRSVMGKVWLKSEGTLTRGEMEVVFRGIDAASGFCFAATHGAKKMDDLIDFVISRPVPPRLVVEPSAPPDEAKTPPEWHPIIGRESSGLVVDVLDGPCGEGKTSHLLALIADRRGRYIYACDKIETIDRRLVEFKRIAGRDAVRFFLAQAHCRQDDFSVAKQLRDIRAQLDLLPAGSAAVVFCTHAAATMMDWSDWTDCEMVVDEVPEVTATFSLNARDNHALLTRYLRAGEPDGECYPITPSEAGVELARRRQVDAYDRQHYGLLVMLGKRNTKVWVRREGWDAPAEHDLKFFAFASPENLSPLRRVWLLGDEALKSLTARVWRERWGVEFRPYDFERRPRAVPTSERLTIYYFSEHRDASITRFAKGHDLPLEDVSRWIAGHAGGEPVLWTTNARLLDRVELPREDFQPPKAHGRNDLVRYRRVAWLAAMRASHFEVATLRDAVGITAGEIAEWRERNTLYQFVMRGDLRDFASSAQNVVYVFSRQQAEYLQRRLGGVIEHVPGVVLDEPVRTKPTVCGEKMTPAERKWAARTRKKMEDAGIDDVRLLPGQGDLDPRRVEIANKTYGRKAA